MEFLNYLKMFKIRDNIEDAWVYIYIYVLNFEYILMIELDLKFLGWAMERGLLL